MGLMKAIFRSKVTKGARQFVGATHVPNGVAHSPGRVSLKTKVVAPPPIPEDSPVKAPDAGKNVAVLSKAVRQQTGDDVAMGAGWAQAIRQKLQGEKKAKAARRKSDRADNAAAAQRRAAMQTTGPAAPFIPRVQLGGEKVTESKDHPINPLNIKAPKGSSQAPGKSIGPIHVAMAAKSKVLTAKINRPTTAVKRVKAVLRKGKGKAAAQRKAPKNMAMAEVKK